MEMAEEMPSKSDYIKYLRDNGVRVKYVLSEKEIELIKNRTQFGYLKELEILQKYKEAIDWVDKNH